MRVARLAALVALMLANLLVPRAFSGQLALAAAPTAAWQTQGPYGDDATALAISPTFDTDHTVFIASAYNSNVGQPTVHPDGE